MRRSSKIAWAFAVCGVLLWSFAVGLSFSARQAPTLGDLRDPSLSRRALKITYIGVQREPVTSLVLLEAGEALSLARFLPYRSRAESDYGNDELVRPDGEPAVMSWVLDSTEMLRVFDALAKVLEGGRDTAAERILSSLMVVATREGQEVGREEILSPGETWWVLKRMAGALDAGAARSLLEGTRGAICGTLDDDGDGIENKCDSCPGIPGTEERWGCGECSGDCSGDRLVTVEELVLGVRVALGEAPLESCLAFDGNGNAAVTVDEIVRAVRLALRACG